MKTTPERQTACSRSQPAYSPMLHVDEPASRAGAESIQ